MTQTHGDAFVTTRWSLVMQAGQPDSPETQAALERLCRDYWRPLYAYVRRLGHSEPDAQDLIQEFFAHFLDRKYFRVADRQRGKFRSFLLVCLKHFLAHEREKSLAAKRGGRMNFIPWDELSLEKEFEPLADSGRTPEQIYDEQWALRIMDRALSKLREDFTGGGQVRQFDLLKEYLMRDPPDGAYQTIGQEIGTNANAVAVSVHRFRRRYRDLVREEITHTLSNPDDIEEEMRHLLDLLVK
jgi:RNA polymerase sigma-70 factor (ECF subfamily)